MLPDLEQLEIGTSAALWDWLGVHHGQGQSVLLVTWKKAAGALYDGRKDVLDALIAVDTSMKMRCARSSLFRHVDNRFGHRRIKRVHCG
jgi:hypothetical protein